MMEYFVEMTDTFGGEANYSWCNRFLVKANTARGAISKVTRETGIPGRYEYGHEIDSIRYNCPKYNICYFLMIAQGNEKDLYSYVKEL